MVRFGLALGGGGAKGLAHVLILEALDEIGLRPHRGRASPRGAPKPDGLKIPIGLADPIRVSGCRATVRGSVA